MTPVGLLRDDIAEEVEAALLTHLELLLADSDTCDSAERQQYTELKELVLNQTCLTPAEEITLQDEPEVTQPTELVSQGEPAAEQIGDETGLAIEGAPEETPENQ